MKTSDIAKSMTALLCLGKIDFKAIEPFRNDRYFKKALNLSKVEDLIGKTVCSSSSSRCW